MLLWLKTQLFYLFYISFSFTVVCGLKNISPNLINSQEPEPHVFGPLEPEPLKKNKKIPGAGVAWGKNQEPETLGKKARS